MKPPVLGEETKLQEETKIQAFGRQEPSHRQPKVRWTDRAGSHSVVLRERTLVGSAPTASLVVSDPAVSRIHAELDPRPDGLWVLDLGSRNGTLVDGAPVVSSRQLARGAELTIGSASIIFRGVGSWK